MLQPTGHSADALPVGICLAYIAWRLIRERLALSKSVTTMSQRLSLLYRRDYFDSLLATGRAVEDIDDSLAECGGDESADAITLFIHPDCKNCADAYPQIRLLNQKARTKVVSLATPSPSVHAFCSRNHINKTPTIIVNGRELPELYSIGDLKYIV